MNEAEAIAAPAEVLPPSPAEGEALPKRGRGKPRGLPKSGGRRKGVINLHALKPGMTTQELRDHVASICASRGFEPISVLANIALNRKVDPKTRTKCAAEVASFLYPRVRSIELSGPDGGPMAMAVGVASLRDWILSLRDDGDGRD